MKSQSLPVSTVALIIIIILVIAASALFFYTMMNSQKNATESSSNLADCQSICSRIQMTNPAGISKARDAANTLGFCSSGCNKAFACTINLPGGKVIRSGVGKNVCTNHTWPYGWELIKGF